MCEGSLTLDIEAWIELDHTFLGRDGRNETGVRRREQIDVNIIANVEGSAYPRHLALEPGLNEIVAEGRLLERAEGIRDHEFAEREAHRLAQKAVILPGQALRKPIRGKRAQRFVAGTFILLENSAGQHDA